MCVDHLSDSYNHIIQFLLSVYSSSQNCEKAPTVMSVFRNDLEEAAHSELFKMTIKLMLRQPKNFPIHQRQNNDH